MKCMVVASFPGLIGAADYTRARIVSTIFEYAGCL